MTLLLDRLDADLQHEFDLSLTEYEILVRLSERPDRSMRMAQLADALAHSRSRVTHTVARMQNAGLVARYDLTRGRPRHRLPPHRPRATRCSSRPPTCTCRACATTSSTSPSPEDFAALGRVMNAVTDRLIACHPEADIRPNS